MFKWLRKIDNILLYLTNNGTTSKDEKLFDKMFFIADVIAIVAALGTFFIFDTEKYFWPALSILFFTQGWDYMRHNR